MRVEQRQGGWMARTWHTLGRALGVQTASAATGWARQIADWLGAGSTRPEVAQPVAENVHAYRGVMVIANTIASLQPVLRRGGEGDPVERGPARELLSRPDRKIRMTWRDLAEELGGHLIASGAAFVLDADMIDDPAGWNALRPPQRLLVVGQSQMTPKYADDHKTLLWWELRERPGCKPLPILPTLAPYIRLFNPYEPWLGLSPLEAAKLGIRQDYKSALFNVAALDNGGQPGGLYVFENLTEDQREEYTLYVEDRHRGARNANKPGVVAGLREYLQTSFNMIDLALVEGRKLSREEIFEALGVPPVLGCVFDAAHYNVADAAQEIFLLNTILPIAEKIAALLTSIVELVEPGLVLQLDASKHPVMQRIERGKHDSLTKLMATGVPYNEAVNQLGLPFKPQPWGNTSLITTTLAPATEVVAGLGGLPTDEGSGNGDQGTGEETERRRDDETEGKGTEARRQRGTQARSSILDPHPFEWASIAAETRAETRQVRAQINPLRQRFKALFLAQERALLAQLRRVVGDAGAAAPRAWERADESDAVRIARRVVVAIHGGDAKLRAIAREAIPRAVEKTLRAELTRLGVPSDQIDAAAAKVMKGAYIKQLMRTKEVRLAGVQTVTVERVRRQLVSGLEAGENVQQLATRVRTVMGGADNYARALRIARTEAGQAVSAARFTAAAAAGANAKGWITGRNPRATHSEAGRTYAPSGGAVAMDEPFEVGGDRLMYPRDPNGSAAEIVNCNCVMVTLRRKKDAAGVLRLRVVNAIGWTAHRLQTGATTDRSAA